MKKIYCYLTIILWVVFFLTNFNVASAGDDYYEKIPQKACSYARSDSKATATANYGTWLILGKKYVLLTREKIYPCVISKDGILECTAEGKQKLQTNVNIVLGEMGHDRRQVDFDSKVTYLSHMVGIPIK